MFRKGILETTVDRLNHVAGPLALAALYVGCKAYERVDNLEGRIPSIIRESSTAAAKAVVAEQQQQQAVEAAA